MNADAKTISTISSQNKRLVMAKTTSKPRKEVKSNPGVIEIYPYKGGYRLRFIGSNGKVLNHTYNTPLSARRGIQAMEKLMRSFVVLKRQ